MMIRTLSRGRLPCAGAKAVCCNLHAEVKDMMSSAPRWAVHQALAERTPATYAARQAPAQELGMSPDMEDAAIAYRLLLEVGGSVSDFLMSCRRVQCSEPCTALVSGAFNDFKQQDPC